jgi:glucose/arabinose dehydrogenase
MRLARGGVWLYAVSAEAVMRGTDGLPCFILAAFLGGFAGCGTRESGQAAGVDGGRSDSGPTPSADSGSSDSSSSTPLDARSPDRDVAENGVDAPSTDAASTDAPSTDAASTDAAGTDAASSDGGTMSPEAMVLPAMCNGTKLSTNPAGPALPAPNPAITVPAGFTIDTIAAIGAARELAALPNGDLLVATSFTNMFLVPNAEAPGMPGTPIIFTTIGDPPVSGVVFAGALCKIFYGAQHGVYAIAYQDALQGAMAGQPIAKVRQGTPTPGSDGDDHATTSVAFAGGKLYVSVGSGCNACVEVDPTRATIQEMDPTGANMTTRATRIRNAIGLTVNPVTGTLWAGGAGQDSLPWGHPYEYFDAVTLHPGIADYGWPDCEENHHAYNAGADCSSTVQPLVELPAYDTIIGAAFYPTATTGMYAFPTAYRGGLFITAHGSWHNQSNQYVHPRVVFVPMNGDAPVTPADWSDPTVQWGNADFVGGFGNGPNYVGRPSGIAVGSQGSLFVADDANSVVYRIRPK